jgi:glutamate formiminotransferase
MAMDRDLLECVINVSEGRRSATIAALAAAGGSSVLDVHSDPDHHRSVLTLAGEADTVERAAKAVARATVSMLDLRVHAGAHPRFGVLDVVPWVSLTGWPVAPGGMEAAVAARDAFAWWAGGDLGVPCFLYGPERTLPEVRREAWKSLQPDYGPAKPHPTAGAIAVGARPVLVAYNLWLAEPDLQAARRIASDLRDPSLRTLAIRVGDHVQVSFNLIDPWALGPGAVYDAVAAEAEVARAELVGLIPHTVLEREPRQRWATLGLNTGSTIEARLELAGLDGGRLRSG